MFKYFPRETTFERVCKMNQLFGVGNTLDDMIRQMDLIREELEEVEEAFVNYRVALEHLELSTPEDIAEAEAMLASELADLRIVGDGMGYIIGYDLDEYTHSKMDVNFKKIMTKPEADIMAARYQGKGLIVEVAKVDEGKYVVKSIREQWLAHKHYPKGKILKRI